MDLTKPNAELFISRMKMKQWKLAKEDVRVTSKRTPHHPFSTIYSLRDGLCLCNDVTELFDTTGVPFVSKK